METYQIYLGRERGKRVVHKVGKATKGCWERCKNADYLIGMSFEIFFPNEGLAKTRSRNLHEAEKFIIGVFGQKFAIEHGKEYFRTTKMKWPQVRELFIAEMTQFLAEKGWQYEIHEGWVAPNTY